MWYYIFICLGFKYKMTSEILLCKRCTKLVEPSRVWMPRVWRLRPIVVRGGRSLAVRSYLIVCTLTILYSYILYSVHWLYSEMQCGIDVALDLPVIRRFRGCIIISPTSRFRIRFVCAWLASNFPSPQQQQAHQAQVDKVVCATKTASLESIDLEIAPLYI